MTKTATKTAKTAKTANTKHRPLIRPYGLPQRPSSAAYPHINRQVLAERLGVSSSYLSLIFAGKRTPKLDLATKMAEALGVSTSKLAAELDGQRTNGQPTNGQPTNGQRANVRATARRTNGQRKSSKLAK